jgi:hypothetical protein
MNPMSDQFNFEKIFPAITEWVHSHGWIEIGQTDEERSLIRAIDEGGLVWEGKSRYPSLDHALRALENALKKWKEENG